MKFYTLLGPRVHEDGAEMHDGYFLQPVYIFLYLNSLISEQATWALQKVHNGILYD